MRFIIIDHGFTRKTVYKQSISNYNVLVTVMLCYCFTPHQRLWLYNGAPLVAFYDTLGIRRTYSRLKPPASSRETCHSTLKASANSFKRFTSRLLKLSFSLYAPIYLGWTSCLISFAWDQSTCQERVGSDKTQNETILPTAGLELVSLRVDIWCSTD